MRPRCRYNVEFDPRIRKFQPASKAEPVKLNPEEAEALRLKDLENLCQTSAARKMKVSQSTFQRVLASAHRKVSRAVIEGRKIRITAPHREK